MPAERNKNNFGFSDLQNPLFLHPSEGLGALSIQDKLIGARNYQSWRRNMEIGWQPKESLVLYKVQFSDLRMIQVKQKCGTLVIA